MRSQVIDMDECSIDDPLYEVVNGKYVENESMGVLANLLAGKIYLWLAKFSEDHGSGLALIETLFLLDSEANLQRRPDVAFVVQTRLPSPLYPVGEDPPVWEFAPNLAVEIVSPGNTAQSLVRKIREYLENNVQLVWVVYPLEQQVHVYDTPSSVKILTINDELDGGSVLPGFRLSLQKLFQPNI